MRVRLQSPVTVHFQDQPVKERASLSEALQFASHYYLKMTKHDRMPLLVGQEI
jgi:hypothetical protein